MKQNKERKAAGKPPRSSKSSYLADLIAQTSRIIHGQGHVDGLYPAQWAALRYFENAQPEGRTSASLARYQGMSLAPVARTARTLEEKGLLARKPNPRDSRSAILEPTAKGRRALDGDPHLRLVALLDTLSAEQRDNLAEGLTSLLLAYFDAES